jgi:hypothetical protein
MRALYAAFLLASPTSIRSRRSSDPDEVVAAAVVTTLDEHLPPTG